MKSTAQLPVIGMDIAKNVFQLHIADVETGEIQRRKLKRAKVAEFFANRQPSLVAIEACGGAHHWARTLQAQGHEVKLLPAKHVRAFVLRDKTDALDAQAIWVAAQQPHIRKVPVKSEQQQACLSLHRMRAQLMKMRIMQTNALRGLLCEFGIVLPEGHNKLLQSIQGELAKAQQDNALPEVLVRSVQEQLTRIDALQDDIDRLDRRLAAMVRQNQHMLAVQAIPGIGPLTATALVAAAADLSTFKSGRQDATTGNFQAGRHLLAHLAGSLGENRRRPQRAQQLAPTVVAATPLQRGGCGAGQQDGAHGLGGPGQRTSL